MRTRRISILAAASLATTLVAGCSSSSGAMQSPAPALTAQIPVVACQTMRGSPVSGPAAFGHHMALGVKASYDAPRLAFYTDDARQLTPVLAPRGWQCVVQIGADGGSGLTVFPHGGTASGPYNVGAQREPACQGCVYDLVCPYIPEARYEVGQGLPPCRQAPIGAGSYDTPAHQDPHRALDRVESLQSNDGSISAALLYRWKRATGGVGALETCQLPKNDSTLCSVILADFKVRNHADY